MPGFTVKAQEQILANLNSVAKDTLKAVGLNVNQLFKISDWRNMCTIRLREGNSFRGLFKAISKGDSCFATLNDEILETRIVLNGPQWKCSWSSSSFVAGTNLSFYQMIEEKYNYAQNFLNLVLKGNEYSISSSAIENLKKQHLFLIKTNKNTAKMDVNCRTVPTKSGFSCDLTLQAKIKYLN